MQKITMIEGYRIHPKATNVIIILMLVTSAVAIFGAELGLSTATRIMMGLPGICGVTLLTFSQARIWEKVSGVNLSDTTSRKLIICDTDIEMAIEFMARDPLTYPNHKPGSWTKQIFIKHLEESVANIEVELKPGTCFLVGHKIWAHINYVGNDLAGFQDFKDEYQVYLSVRKADTESDKFNNLRI